MKCENQMVLEFPSKSINEAFARAAVACFAAQLDPTLDELGDIKTAVSEADQRHRPRLSGRHRDHHPPLPDSGRERAGHRHQGQGPGH